MLLTCGVAVLFLIHHVLKIEPVVAFSFIISCIRRSFLLFRLFIFPSFLFGFMSIARWSAVTALAPAPIPASAFASPSRDFGLEHSAKPF